MRDRLLEKEAERMAVQDPVLILLASQFSQRGHKVLPLKISKVKNSYIIVHERKRFSDGSDFIDEACKITPVKSTGLWKLFWKRADLKWHLYETYPTLEAVVAEVKSDPHNCFWG